jgi:hypothetical protein
VSADGGAAEGRRLPSPAAYLATAGATVAGWASAAWLWSRGSRPLAFAAFAALAKALG